MGFKDCFGAQQPATDTNPPVRLSDPPMRSPSAVGNALGVRPSPIMSVSSSQISGTEDIKHEVMVNYLYQQQCGHMWVSSVQAYKRSTTPFQSPKYPRTPNEESPFGALMGMVLSVEQEGVILRKSRGNYLACPQDLLGTPLEMACRALNVSVSPLLLLTDLGLWLIPIPV